MTVYSSKLGEGTQVGPGALVLFTAPAGKTSVLRDVRVGAESAPSNQFAIIVFGTRIVFGASDVAQYGAAGLECRIVLDPGDTVQLNSIAGTWDCVLSGYLLD